MYEVTPGFIETILVRMSLAETIPMIKADHIMWQLWVRVSVNIILFILSPRHGVWTFKGSMCCYKDAITYLRKKDMDLKCKNVNLVMVMYITMFIRK